MRRVSFHKDKHHDQVGAIWVQCGWQMLSLHTIGRGAPDWLAVKDGRCVLIEVKTEGWRRPSSLTQQRQEKFQQEWTACPLITIETLEDAWKRASGSW